MDGVHLFSCCLFLAARVEVVAPVWLEEAASSEAECRSKVQVYLDRLAAFLRTAPAPPVAFVVATASSVPVSAEAQAAWSEVGSSRLLAAWSHSAVWAYTASLSVVSACRDSDAEQEDDSPADCSVPTGDDAEDEVRAQVADSSEADSANCRHIPAGWSTEPVEDGTKCVAADTDFPT